MRTIITGAAVLIAIEALAAPPLLFEKRPAVRIANEKIEFLVLPEGAMIASATLRDDTSGLNPLWNPARMDREAHSTNPRNDGFTGHFLALDGFGPPSEDEKAAGLTMHGEATRREFALDSSYTNREGVYVFSTDLPIAQERLTRTLRLRDGEQVLQVDTEVESLLGFDRPVFWAEHATVGSPFLEPEFTVVDMPAAKSKTRPYAEGSPDAARRRLAPDTEFKWPLAPLVSGKFVNLRAAPAKPGSMDHTASQMDPARPIAFVTVLNTRRHFLLGYLFRTAEYPWVQNWESYPDASRLARGLEFGTQPFDTPRREAVSAGSLWGTPWFRFLSARGKVTSRFIMFYARVPAGLASVDDVRLEKGAVVIEDAVAKITVKLPTKAEL